MTATAETSESTVVTNEEWSAEYISVIFRTLVEMIHVPLENYLPTFAGEWVALPRTKFKEMEQVDLASDPHAIYHVLRKTISPVASVEFEYEDENADVSIFGDEERVDSFYVYERIYSYNDMLATVLDASIKLRALTNVALDPRLYTATNILFKLFVPLRAFGAGTPLNLFDFNKLMEVVHAFTDFIAESNDEDEDEE